MYNLFPLPIIVKQGEETAAQPKAVVYPDEKLHSQPIRTDQAQGILVKDSGFAFQDRLHNFLLNGPRRATSIYTNSWLAHCLFTHRGLFAHRNSQNQQMSPGPFMDKDPQLTFDSLQGSSANLEQGIDDDDDAAAQTNQNLMILGGS